jgi:metal-responsive CopG/Arc/MetJ family transcriptional regulator
VTKILISIDDRLLERLDKEAAALGISRSALIARLTATALGEPVGPGANPEVQAALDRLKELFRGEHDNVDSTQVIRQMRDSR